MSKPVAAAKPQKTPSAGKARLARVWVRTRATAGKVASKVVTQWTELLHGAPAEKRRVVVTSNWRAIVSKSAIHILPVLATIVLAYLNVRGYFIGVNMQGLASPAAQDLNRLCLQVTAKIVELLVVASLGVILLDAIRDKLLFGTEGVPLGLVLANVRFGDVSYLFTHDFRAGWSGFHRVRTRLLFALLIVVCSIIGLFAGPATALLIIPEYYDAWPAGGASFTLEGDLFPSRLKVNDDLRATCSNFSANESLLQIPNPNVTSCPWAGHSGLSAEFMQMIMSVEKDLVYSVANFRQDLAIDWDLRPDDINKHSARVWVAASNVAIASFSRYISQIDWTMALRVAREVQPGRYLSSLRYRDRSQTTAVVKSKMPLVRTQCFLVDDWAVPADMAESASTSGERVLPFPLMRKYAGLEDYAFFVYVNATNTTSTSATWLQVSDDPYLESYGVPGAESASALLFIQKPSLPLSGSDMTCSVKAHWVEGKNVASHVAWYEASQSRAEINPDVDLAVKNWGGGIYKTDVAFGPSYRPPWQDVELTWDWLNLLTPDIDPEHSGRNTLAVLIESAAQSSNTNASHFANSQDVEENDVVVKIGTIVASFIADGMSRTGWRENAVQDLNSLSVYNGAIDAFGWNWQSKDWDQVYSRLIKGTASLVPNIRRTDGEGKTFNMDVKIQGYGIKASSTVYWLALTVLFAHLCLVAGHTVYTIYRRRAIRVWSSVTDFVVLSQVSSPPKDGALKDCSTGVKTHEVLRKQLRIRSLPHATPGSEELQLVIGKDFGDKVEYQRPYGARP